MQHTKPLTILLTAPQPFFQERGTPIAVRLLCETLAAQGYDVHLLVYHEGEDIEISGVTLHRSLNLPFIKNIRPGMSLKKIFCDLFILIEMIRLHRRYSFDLVHAVEESVFLAQFLKLFTKTPYIYDMDSSMSEQIIDKHPHLKSLGNILESFEKRAVRSSMGVIAVCRALEDTARDYSPETPILRLEDISMVDEEAQGDEKLREQLEISGVLMVYVGNLESYQGIGLLLEGFAQARVEIADASLLIIGGNQDDIAKYELVSNNLGIQDRVIFCGPRPMNLLGYYLSQADILVSPRTQGNNTPMKIYSYLGSGKAVLATRLPTHTQALTDDVSCLVSPDPKSMAAGIEQLCADSSLRERLGKNGKALAENEYSMAAYIKKLSSFYRKITLNDDMSENKI
jgi:glycosyltransferase involved in cell wall biosynthesis